ncbi:ankyrin repeat-containing domain protein [Entophlyctis helioformis]|nr:ankyrin repeat-containing domain protein [Entophlyctis helioformis]
MNIFRACQTGNLARVTDLVDNGQASAFDQDPERCTPLHWAAINNHIAIAKFLIDRGAVVDAAGGDLNATPLHWASRTGHVQMVTFLHKRGANPNLLDGQGYNALHLAVHAGHLMMIVYLISIGVDVEAPDTLKRTPLMWCAYQGNSIEALEEILRAKPALDVVDSTGYTALHWAVISFHFEFAKRLIEEGVSLDVKDPAGKTPRDWAVERGSADAYDRILYETGKSLGRKQPTPYSKETTNRIMYAIPFVAIPTVITILSTLPFYFAIPLVILLVFHLQKNLIVKYLLADDAEKLASTPLIASIMQSTLFYVFISWIRLLPYTGFLYFSHIAFLALFSTNIYCMYMGFVSDPGYIRKASSPEEKCETVVSLAENGMLDARNYCTSCEIRKPIRSKHCRVCNRCVAKFDHHCPWTFNCIGHLNHRYFMVFCITLVMGGSLFVWIAFQYVAAVVPTVPASYPSSNGWCILGDTLCSLFSFDTWTLLIAFWATFHVTWVAFLLVMQLMQVAWGRTTNESANYHRFSYLVHPEDIGAPPYRRRLLNPFDMGPIANCVDFWSGGAGKLKSISWFNLYEVPKWLMTDALRRAGHGEA